MIQGVVPPELVVGGVALILAGLVIYIIIRLTSQGAVAKDDLREARKAAMLREKAEAAEALERKKDEGLR